MTEQEFANLEVTFSRWYDYKQQLSKFDDTDFRETNTMPLF